MNYFLLQKFRFQKYGKRDNIIKIERQHPLLIWSNVKLFNWSNDLYTVGVSGEKREHINFCSALVFNDKGENCFDENSKIKDSDTVQKSV